MNPHACRVALRPRGPLEVLDLTVRLVRERWRPLVHLSTVTLLPAWLPTLVLCWAFDGHWLLLVWPLLLAAPLQAPFTLLGGRLLFADAAPVRETLGDLVERGPWLVGAWLVGLFGWACGFASFGPLVPVAQVALLYLTEAALLERVGSVRGVQRSFRLAGGHLGHAVAGVVVKWSVLVWFAMVGESAGRALTRVVLQIGEPFGTLTDGHVTPWLLGGLILAQPAIALYRLLLYVDVRTRVEGWDLQVGLRAAGLAR